jgi:hypothetical protein
LAALAPRPETRTPSASATMPEIIFFMIPNRI